MKKSTCKPPENTQKGGATAVTEAWDTWETILSFWDTDYFQGLSFREGSILYQNWMGTMPYPIQGVKEYHRLRSAIE